MDTLFQIVNTLGLISWIYLIGWSKGTRTITILRFGVITALGLTYIFLIAPLMVNMESDTFTSLENIQAMFLDDRMTVAGWIHYLAFDLFVGTWIVTEGISRKMPRWKYILCLPFTFMFGPLGLLLFYLMLYFHKNK